MQLFPSAEIVLGQNSRERKYWHVEDELGNRPDHTDHAVKYRIYKRILRDNGDILDELLADVAGVYSDELEAEFYVDFTEAESCDGPGVYIGELAIWADGAAVDVPPILRFIATATIGDRMTAP